MNRSIPSDIVEQWLTHLRLQRARARDTIWLIGQGATLHDGHSGEPLHDATERWLIEQRVVVSDVDRLVQLYDDLNRSDPI